METITINLIDPKAKKLMDDLVCLGIISIDHQMEPTGKCYNNQELLHELEEDIQQYEQGTLKTFSKEDVFVEISKRRGKSSTTKLTK
ncbi:MAG: hypothetical protein IPK62_09890 [Bacteroidetes bacterium]|nr:hypothetical protein [Bacteroidota bacterium]